MNQPLTAFEQAMQTHYPEVYALMLLAKSKDNGGGGEIYVYHLIEAIVAMSQNYTTGSINIKFTKGRIEDINVTTKILAFANQLRLDKVTPDTI